MNLKGDGVIKYYGTPLTPRDKFIEIMSGRNCLIPYPRPQDLNRALQICDKVIIDNGAFTLWRKGGKIDWNDFYDWMHPFKERIEFFFIPDVIDGTEEENDQLISDYFKRGGTKGVPIWHINESFERLDRLMNSFDYIAFGSSGEYAQLGTRKWYNQMDKAMRIVCDEQGIPKVKIHMLRCLDAKIFTQFPFFSGDSTSLAQNYKRDGWEQITSRIERYNSPNKYDFKNYYTQKGLF